MPFRFARSVPHQTQSSLEAAAAPRNRDDRPCTHRCSVALLVALATVMPGVLVVIPLMTAVVGALPGVQ